MHPTSGSTQLEQVSTLLIPQAQPLPSPTATKPGPRLRLNTTTTPITLSPAKTAFVIINMQNIFFSPSFGRAEGAGHAAMEKLLQFAIPAARKAGTRII